MTIHFNLIIETRIFHVFSRNDFNAFLYFLLPLFCSESLNSFGDFLNEVSIFNERLLNYFCFSFSRGEFTAYFNASFNIYCKEV